MRKYTIAGADMQRGSGERRSACNHREADATLWRATEHPTGRRLPPTTGAKTNGMWSRVLDKNSTSFAQECTVRLFLENERSAGAAATSGVGLPGPAADHRNNFSSWQYLATWWSPPPKGAYLVPATDKSPLFCTLGCVKFSSRLCAFILATLCRPVNTGICIALISVTWDKNDNKLWLCFVRIFCTDSDKWCADLSESVHGLWDYPHNNKRL